ncbi:MAG: tetratricopeptide repeat protein [Patescibacteria group bacterium]|nr:tetratricopeptide repeat protein [Patescibacteria group bacterium]MDD5716061.1 tetratricopeptide repeat protein [Patescibacteria group bacterium]
MIIDYIAIGVIVVCFGVVLSIIVKKFPTLASINTDTLTKHKQERVKKHIIEHRLKRKLQALTFRTAFQHDSSSTKKASFVRNLYSSLKEMEEKYRRKIKELEPQDATDEKSRGILLKEASDFIAQDKYKEAESKYIEAISLDRKCVEAYEGLAQVYTQLKDYQHAQEIYRYLLKISVPSGDADNSTHGAGTAVGGSVRANLNADSVTTNDAVAGYHREIGKLFLLDGNAEQALGSFQESVKLEPNNPKNLDHVIDTALKLENKAVATEYLEKLRGVNPENEKLQELEERIQELDKA